MAQTERERISETDLMQVSAAALMSVGASSDAARDCAEVLVIGEMMGLTTHGIGRIPTYAERLTIGGIDSAPAMRMEILAPAMRRLDGANGLGPAVGMTALRTAMEAARETGIAIVFCAGSNHFGAIAPYALMAAEAGFASLIGSNASVTIAPSGGRETRLGNNPLGFGFPNPGGDPIILDMAMSVVARGKIRDAARSGTPIPADWATDSEGGPTTDAATALKGFLLPFGGYKGYGLSLCVDMLTGLMSGAAYLTHVSSWLDAPEKPQNLGHTFILIDTARLMPATSLGDRMEDFGGLLHNTPPVDPGSPVLLPGERELKRLATSRADGVWVNAETLRHLRQMGA